MQPECVPTPPTLDISMEAPTSLEELDSFPHTDASNPLTFDSPNPQITQAGRPLWHYCLPTWYQDLLPDGPAPARATNCLPPVTQESTVLP